MLLYMEGVRAATNGELGPERLRRRSRQMIEQASHPPTARPDEAVAQLRSFAPRAVADRIEQGLPVDAGEREVSVLFADLRRYAAYAESCRPAEIFGALSRYAGALTQVIHDHGGEVVDFGGDGVMAVFGAPVALPEKEREAVEAAWEICHIVMELSGGRWPWSRCRLSAGVGVATGPAFVGGIRAGSRTFWSAVGSTTNLAARLQRLTRQLECAIAVDARTRRGAGQAGSGLERRSRVEIRGHARPEDIYLLPLGAL